MAKIELNNKRKSTGSYQKLTGNKDIANFTTSFHAAAICSGNEVTAKLEKSYEGTLPIFSKKDTNSPEKTFDLIKNNPEGVIIFNGYVANQKDNGKIKKIEVDLIVYVDNVVHCYEIKEGDNFDTKKSKSEIDNLIKISNSFKELNFEVEVGFVCMNLQNDNHSIKDNRINQYLLRGRFLCSKFNFNFDNFNQLSLNEQEENEHLCILEMERIIKEYKNKLNATTL